MKSFKEIDCQDITEANWDDAEKYTDVLKYAIETIAKKKEFLITDVKRDGTNSIKVKMKDKNFDEIVANITIDPTYKF